METNTASRRAAGILLALAGLIYFVTEAISAAAWTHPVYSYATDYISDLGVPGGSQYVFAHTVNSPLSIVMNIGFIANAVLAFAGATMFLLGIRSARTRITWVASLIFAVGLVLVGLFHGSAASVGNGQIALHGAGAIAAIVFGNLVLVLLGSLARRYVPRWFANFALVIGVLGLVCFVLQTVAVLPQQPGIFERGSVYTIMAGQIVGVVTLVAGSRRRATPSEPSVGSPVMVR